MSRSYWESVNKSITPDFLDASKTQKSPNSQSNSNTNPRKSPLRNYEASATNQKSTSANSAKDLEAKIPYTGTGQPHHAKRQRFKSATKKAGPLTFVFTAIIAFAGILFFFTAQLGFQVQELLTVNTSRDYGTYQMLSRSTTRQILAGKYRMTDKFKTRLEGQGFTVTAKDTGGYELKYKDTIATADNFNDIINSDPEFRDAFTKAKRGRIANFFDDKAEALYKKLGISRNVFNNYEQTGDAKTDTENYKKTYSEQFSENADTHTNLVEDRTTTDEDGNETTERTSSGEDINTKSLDGDTPNTKATSYIQSVSNRVADGLSTAETGCAVLKIGTMVSMAVSAYEMYQSIHQFMLEMENVSKTKIGEGDSAALNAQNNEWTREVTTSYLDIDTGEEKPVTGSFMSSEGIKSAVSGEPANKSKVRSYSTERSLLATFTAIGTNQLSTTACSAISATNAAFSLATLAVPGSGFVKIAIGAIKQVAIATTLQIAISGLISTLVPIVAQTLFTNPAELTGIPHGEQTVKGASASAYLSATANSGYTPASKERTLEANKLNQVIIAQEAEEDRLDHSPFDTSSPNTFLGSLVTKTLPTTTNNNILSSIVKLSSLTTSSISRPTFAEGENSSYLTTYGDCPTTEEQGIASDIYCIPTTAADTSTIDLEDDDPIYQDWLASNITTDSSGDQSVIPCSFLGLYLEVVSGRESLPGNYDSGIADRVFECQTGGASSIAQDIPYISDVFEIVGFLDNAEIEPWARGTICNNSADNPRWDSDCKYAQHYIQKSRILNQIGYYEDSKDPIATFQSESEYLNPTDTSRVATLARMTGLSHEDADLTLAFLDYTSYLASYRPETTYIFTPNSNSTSSSRHSSTPTIAELTHPTHTTHNLLKRPSFIIDNNDISKLTDRQHTVLIAINSTSVTSRSAVIAKLRERGRA